jgi:predicted transcriptional regulator of viral defense system
MAGQQFGRISAAQIAAMGVPKQTVSRWVRDGYLHLVLPHVYAVGHRSRTTESDLAAAVLYAGPGAMLSHATAAWWVGLVESKPYRIEVSTPRRRRSLPGLRVHQRRSGERVWHKGLPITPIGQTLLDYASVASLSKLRRALAQADYEGTLNVNAIQAELRRGRPGSTRLRLALQRHQPRLAHARSRVERALLELCEAGGLPLPELNVRVAGWTVDAVWRQDRLVVELDGWRNHRTPAQVNRDRQKELELRAAGFTVVRYSEEQIVQHPQVVLDELRWLLARAPLTNPGPSA